MLNLVLFALLVLPRVARSDGLIYQMPAEGGWARYEEKVTGEFSAASNTDRDAVLHKQSVDQTRKLMVKSLHRVKRHEQMCRWIELSSEPVSAGGPDETRVLKLLVPEDYLKRGQDPLSHAIKTFFSPSPNDRSSGRIMSRIDEGFNRIQYELDRIRVVFPKPLDNVKSEPRETLELHGRKWVNCEILTGTRHYDGPLGNDGRWVFDAQYRIALHRDAPFGIVSMKVICDSTEYSKTTTVRGHSTERISLAEVGQGAQSQMRPMTDQAKAKGHAGPAQPRARAREKTGEALSINSLPQIRELDRIFKAKDGDAFRAFVLLGSPAAKKGVDDAARQVDAGELSVTEVLNSRVDGPLVRIWAKVSIAGRQQTIPFRFVKRGDKWQWLFVLGGERLQDAKAVLSDAEWQALLGEDSDTR